MIDKQSATRLLNLEFSRVSPKAGAEYWLLGGVFGSSASLKVLPEELGFSWFLDSQRQLIIDYVGGELGGESELVDWEEFEMLLGGKGCLM